VPVLAAQPGIINYAAAGGNSGVILHANYQLADSAHPAVPGETVLIYCTGLGAVSENYSHHLSGIGPYPGSQWRGFKAKLQVDSGQNQNG
jgi:uncharacterized protein (TIGR03437 family)